MGLDLYYEIAKRSRVEKVKDKREKLEQSIDKECAKKNPNQDKINKLRNKYDELNPYSEVAYFRKVNFLIPFFNYADNCRRMEIEKCQIEDLISTCQEVLENHSKAEELLPTTAGFFFGSTEYDKYYFDDVQEVKDTFQKILNKFNPDKDVLTMYCWW